MTHTSCPDCGWVRPLPPNTPMTACPCGWNTTKETTTMQPEPPKPSYATT